MNPLLGLMTCPYLSLRNFLQCPLLIGCRKNPSKFTCPQAACGLIFQDHIRVPISVFTVQIAASEPRKGLLEEFLELVSNFIEASKNLKSNITTKISKTISAHTKSTNFIF